jgi:hypothetical protein
VVGLRLVIFRAHREYLVNRVYRVFRGLLVKMVSPIIPGSSMPMIKMVLI